MKAFEVESSPRQSIQNILPPLQVPFFCLVSENLLCARCMWENNKCYLRTTYQSFPHFSRFRDSYLFKQIIFMSDIRSSSKEALTCYIRKLQMSSNIRSPISKKYGLNSKIT
jgi:hypothetical protein